MTSLLVHATTVALGSAAAVIRGASGAGKSDLALRFLATASRWPHADRPRTLVADDQTWLHWDGSRLIASAPTTIAGNLEVRGVGIMTDIPCAPAEVRLVIDLVAPGAVVERLPDIDATIELLGRPVPHRWIAPFESSAALKVVLLLGAFSLNTEPAQC